MFVNPFSWNVGHFGHGFSNLCPNRTGKRWRTRTFQAVTGLSAQLGTPLDPSAKRGWQYSEFQVRGEFSLIGHPIFPIDRPELCFQRRITSLGGLFFLARAPMPNRPPGFNSRRRNSPVL